MKIERSVVSSYCSLEDNLYLDLESQRNRQMRELAKNQARLMNWKRKSVKRKKRNIAKEKYTFNIKNFSPSFKISKTFIVWARK